MLEPDPMRIVTYSGPVFDIQHATIEDIRLEDIAHSLSMKARFGGHTRCLYSVAQHSVYVSWMVREMYQKAALLHDATEAYMQDLPRPIKQRMKGYQLIEQVLAAKIAISFELPIDCFEAEPIMAMDNLIQALEAKTMLINPQPVFDMLGRPDKDIFSVDPNFTYWTPMEAERRFLARYAELRNR